MEVGGNKMGNAPVITLSGFSLYPDVDPEIWERYTKWASEVYAPLMMKYPARKGIDFYQIVRENPLYPFRLGIHHHETLTSQQNTVKTPEQVAIMNDSSSWVKRNVIDHIWSAVYQLVRGFRSAQALPGGKPDTRIQNAPVMHLEAYRLSPEGQDKYNKWFAEYGMNIFIPLFMKQPGVKGYDFYKFTGTQVTNVVRETDYPAHLSVFYFENMQAFENFERNPERTTFHKIIRNVFPLGLNYSWYVQYQLIDSLRK
jgi:hypothetical protein